MSTVPHNLQVGDTVLLTGVGWGSRQNTTARVDTIEGDGQPWSDEDAIGSLAGPTNWYSGEYAAELYSRATDAVNLKNPTAAQIEAFQKAWADADRLGLKGQRTRAGLIAVLNLKETA